MFGLLVRLSEFIPDRQLTLPERPHVMPGAFCHTVRYAADYVSWTGTDLGVSAVCWCLMGRGTARPFTAMVGNEKDTP